MLHTVSCHSAHIARKGFWVWCDMRTTAAAAGFPSWPTAAHVALEPTFEPALCSGDVPC